MKWLNKTIWGFGLTSFFNDFSHEMCTAILPAFIQQLIGPLYTPTALGLIAGISNGIATSMKLLSGLLANRLQNYKQILIVGYTITPLFSGLIGTAHTVWQVLIYKTLAWAGRGLREPIRDAWLSQELKPAFYGRAFGFQRALDTLGAIAGPLIAFWAIQYYNLQMIFFISFIPGILSVISLIIFTRQPNRCNIDTCDRKTAGQFQHSKKTNNLSILENYKKLPSDFRNFVKIRLIFSLAHFNKTLLIFQAQTILTGSSTHEIAAGASIALYTFFNVIRALSELSMGSLSDYVNRKNLLAFAGFGLFSITCLILLLNPIEIFWWLVIFLCAGLSTGTITALEKSYAAELLPMQQRGWGYGILQTSIGTGELISNAIIGAIWTFISASTAFLYVSIVSFLATVLLIIKKN